MRARDVVQIFIPIITIVILENHTFEFFTFFLCTKYTIRNIFKRLTAIKADFIGLFGNNTHDTIPFLQAINILAALLGFRVGKAFLLQRLDFSAEIIDDKIENNHARRN